MPPRAEPQGHSNDASRATGNADLNSDQYLWKTTIEEAMSAAVDSSPAAKAPSAAAMSWDSVRDFANKSPHYLDPWHQLAQVLLLSNELMFVD